MARELALHAAALRPRARAAFLPLSVYVVEERRELRGRREFRERGRESHIRSGVKCSVIMIGRWHGMGLF